LKINKFTYN